jgi:hypothetical protein
MSKAAKTTIDLTRARLAVQNSHRYFSSALKICDGIRGSPIGRSMLGALNGIGEMDKMSLPRCETSAIRFAVALTYRSRVGSPCKQSPDLLE